MLTPKSLGLAAEVSTERSTICKLSTLDKTFKQFLNLVLHCTSLYCSASIRDCFGSLSAINSWAATQCYYAEPSEKMWSSRFPW